jgi:phosphohistidine phosphatase
MSLKLYLVRHATATEGIGGAIRSDAERPLVDEGRKEAHAVADALVRMGVKPDVFLTSPLVRARQTAEIFAEVFGQKGDLHFSDALAPGGSRSQLWKDVNSYKRAREMFLFGHQPDMSMLAALLLDAGDQFDMPFKKAAVARIDVYDLPPTSPGTLKWFVTPKMVKALV